MFRETLLSRVALPKRESPFRTTRRGAAVAVERPDMRAMVLAACRTLVPLVPMAAGRAGARGTGRTQRGRGGGGGSSRGGAGAGRGGRGPPRPSRGEAAGETGGVGRPSPRWGWDQRADAKSEARRGVSTSAPVRDALFSGNGDVPSSSSPDDAPQRVSKLMAWRGLCSRREAEELISRGVVTVDGAVAKQGDKALSDARIEIADAAGARWLRSKITVVLNKPVGFVSNLPGPGEREASELVTGRNAFRESDREGLLDALDETNDVGKAGRAPGVSGLTKLNVCGRLDKDSRGLLVLTQDGVLARAVIGGNEIPKTYVVRLDRPVTDEQVRVLNGPVSLEGVSLLPMKVERAPFAPDVLRFTLREGKNRQIRRVCDAAGLRVVDLERVKVGGCELGDLPEGAWRLMTDAERESLRAAGGAARGEGRARAGPGGRGRRRL
jgi:23S rRNA pseudouridine2604 synthase